MLPTLPEIDPTAVQVVPTDFSEEVARAQAAKAAGWLRLLASEVTDRRFQWSALRSIGKAQWQLMDYVGARRTWLRVREAIPDDLDANLALTNLLERQYRCEKRPELLEASNQAIANIVASKRATAEQRAEALALHGRNLKTLWRLNFEGLGDLADRRQKATNRSLIGSYEAYRQAYLVDLNHYWSGLAALQMGTVALDLAGKSAWEDSFDDAEQAAAYKTELARQVEATRVGVRLAVNAAIERLARGPRPSLGRHQPGRSPVPDRGARSARGPAPDAVPADESLEADEGQLQLCQGSSPSGAGRTGDQRAGRLRRAGRTGARSAPRSCRRPSGGRTGPRRSTLPS